MKAGRNDPCPCGSGKKFKHCCGVGALVQQAAPSVAQLMEMGLQHHRMGKLEAAEKYYLEALAKKPRDAGVLNLLGLAALQRGEAAQAVEWLRKAVSMDGREPQYRNNLAAALKAAGDIAASIETLNLVLAAHPGYQEGWYNLGNALEECDRLDESAEAYRKAIKLQPTDADAYYGLGRALKRLEDLDGALGCFNKVLELRPHDRKAYRRLGLIYALQGKDGESESCFRQALQVDPQYVDALVSLSELLMLLGRHEEAEKLAFEAIRIDPENTKAYFSLAGCKKFSQDDLPLLQKIEGVVEKEAADEDSLIEAHYALGKTFNDLKIFDKAFSHYAQANRIAGVSEKFDRERHQNTVDRIIGACTRELFEASRAANPSDLPIFIVGMPRSGTTLTEQIISSHPLVYGAGELTFWAEQSKKLDSECLPKERWGELAKVAEAYVSLLHGYSPEARHLTDKMPGNYLYLGLIHLAFPNARIIHCRRNPVDTCLSIYFQKFTGHAYRHDLEDLAYVYRQYRRLMQHWRETLPASVFMEVEYEELVANQEMVSRQLIDFCGLEWDERCLEFYKNERVIKTASQWQVRQPMYKTSKERWRNYEPWIGPLRELLDEDELAGAKG